MVEYGRYVKKISEKSGFIVSTIEKVERLLNILEWINNDFEIGQMLALKGGTAINTVIFNFPRLSVDIDLDLNKKYSKEEMLEKREYINDILSKYLISKGYIIDNYKSKSMYALDSIVVGYTDIKGNKDNIKIEINYMLRTHILETQKLKIFNDLYKDKNLKILCINPIEIYSAKICALINRSTARDLFDVYNLVKYDLFNSKEKIILRKCFLFEYIAICDYKTEDLNLSKIEKISKQDIKTRLLPTLKNRNPKNYDVELMQKEVLNYLKDFFVLTKEEKEFYDNFQLGIYKPELLFKEKEILERIKEHPMVIWKLNDKKL